MDLLDATQVMANAEVRTYLGNLTETDAKALVSRHFMVSRLTDMQMNLLVNDPRLGYDGTTASLVRHAVEMLLDYYVRTEAFGEHQGFASDITRQQHEARLDAERARLRAEFASNIRVFDKELDVARQLGDFAYIGKRLEKYLEMLESCQTETERRQVREILAESVATRSAALSFNRWCYDKDRVSVDEWRDFWYDLSDRWVQWYQDWQ
jgi:hypothetical protein